MGHTGRGQGTGICLEIRAIRLHFLGDYRPSAIHVTPRTRMFKRPACPRSARCIYIYIYHMAPANAVCSSARRVHRDDERSPDCIRRLRPRNYRRRRIRRIPEIPRIPRPGNRARSTRSLDDRAQHRYPHGRISIPPTGIDRRCRSRIWSCAATRTIVVVFYGTRDRTGGVSARSPSLDARPHRDT